MVGPEAYFPYRHPCQNITLWYGEWTGIHHLLKGAMGIQFRIENAITAYQEYFSNDPFNRMSIRFSCEQIEFLLSERSIANVITEALQPLYQG